MGVASVDNDDGGGGGGGFDVFFVSWSVRRRADASDVDASNVDASDVDWPPPVAPSTCDTRTATRLLTNLATKMTLKLFNVISTAIGKPG